MHHHFRTVRSIGLIIVITLASCEEQGFQIWDANLKKVVIESLELTPLGNSRLCIDPLGKTVQVEFHEVDLNSDNVPELIVCIEGSLYLSGVTGQSCGVYQISMNGIIKELMLVPALSIEVVNHIYNGYSVMKVQPRGEPKLWGWNNGGYSIIFDSAGTVK